MLFSQRHNASSAPAQSVFRFAVVQERTPSISSLVRTAARRWGA